VRAATAIGLVGCGSWGKHILRDLVALGCDVSVVARSERTTATAREGGAFSVVGSIPELPAVDGIVVATPTAAHALTVAESLERDVPVFVEKPLTHDLTEAQRLAESAPDRLFVMDKWRYHPGIELLASIGRSGELGRVEGLRTTRVGWGNPHTDVDSIWILAPHDLAIGLEILGALPQPRTAVADAANGSATGLVGLLGDKPWLAIEVGTRTLTTRREISLVCEEGVAVLPDGYSDRVLMARGVDPRELHGVEPEVRPISTEFPLLRELRAFVEFLGGGPPPRSSAEEGVAIVRCISELRSLAGLPS
jgi:predicted dehydrogenase